LLPNGPSVRKFSDLMTVAALLRRRKGRRSHYGKRGQRGPLFEGARPRLELNALGAVNACVPAATAPGPTRNNGGCLTGGGSLGGTGIPPPTLFIVSESGHLSCDADHKKSLLSDNSCGSATISDRMPRSLSPQKRTPSAVHLGSELLSLLRLLWLSGQGCRGDGGGRPTGLTNSM
jgi:hypothetical protein